MYGCCWVWKGSSRASDLPSKGGTLLLMVRTTIGAWQVPQVSWKGNKAFRCWAGFLQTSEGRTATGRSRVRLWEHCQAMVQQLEGEGMEGQVNILKKHTTVCRGRDELMKESTDSFKGDSYTRGSPPSLFSHSCFHQALCFVHLRR